MLAIVLVRKDIKEFDQIVSLYTREQGKKDALAKGIKKITSKNSSNLEIISVVEVEIAQGKEIDHLTKVQPIKIFHRIYSDADKILLAGYIIQVFDDTVLAGEKDAALFDFLLGFFEFLNTASTINSLSLATGFIFKFWHHLGFGELEGKYALWLGSSWDEINNLHVSKTEAQLAYQAALQFAQYHTGKKLAKFIESDRIIG